MIAVDVVRANGELIRDILRTAFKKESTQNPNYGKATGLGAEKWWSNVSLMAV